MIKHLKTFINLCLSLWLVGYPAVSFADSRCPMGFCPGIKQTASLSQSDGLDGFGAFERKKPKHTSTPSPTPTPTPSVSPTPSPSESPTSTATPSPSPTPSSSATPTPTSTPSPSPSPNYGGGGNGNNGLNGLNGLGGAGGGLLSGLVGGLAGGLGGGLLGAHGSTQGWGSDQWGGTNGPDKYGTKKNFADQLLDKISKEQKSGSQNRDVQCDEDPQFPEAPPGTILGPGDNVVDVLGSSGQFGTGAGEQIAARTGSNYSAVGSTSDALEAIHDHAAGKVSHPGKGGKPSNLLVNINCHGSGDYTEGPNGNGLTGAQIADAINAGHADARANGRQPGIVSIADGACMPCRGNTIKQNVNDLSNVHYLTGANPNQYNYSSGGASFASQQIIHVLNDAGFTATNPGAFTGSMWNQAHSYLSPNGTGQRYRASPWQKAKK